MATRLSVPTTSEKLSYVINDFSGGLVNNVNDAKMLDNQSPDMLNMKFRNDGLLEKRPGINRITLPSLDGFEPFDVIYFEYDEGKILNIFVDPYQMYYFHDGSNTPIVVWQDERVSNGEIIELDKYDFSYCCYNKKLYFVNYAGLFVIEKREDIFLNVYKVVNPPEDYTPKPEPALTGETKQSTPIIYDSYYIHNTSSFVSVDGCNYSTIWYEPCAYEIADGYKGSNVIPSNCKYITVHKDRIYLSGNSEDENMVYISDILNPYYFPASLPIQLPPNNDYITALHNYNDSLIIGRKHSIFALFGNTNRDNSYEYTLTELNSHTGIVNHRSVNNVFHMLFFVGSDGNFYKLLPPSTSNTTLYTTQLNTNIDITKPPFNLSVEDCNNAFSIFEPTNCLWYVQISEHTLVYSYSLRAWTRYNNINAVNFYVYNNCLYFLRTGYGFCYIPTNNENVDYCDNYYYIDKEYIVPFNAYWTSRILDMGQPARVKQFRDTYVTSECFEECPSLIRVNFEVDYIDVGNVTFIENEIGKWNTAIFNKSKFTNRNIDRSLPLMINRRGRTLKIYFGNCMNYVGEYVINDMSEFPDASEFNEYDVFNVRKGNFNTFYQRVPRQNDSFGNFEKYFKPLTLNYIRQNLLVHNITCMYQLKGYR